MGLYPKLGSLRVGSLREGSLREGSLREGSLREGSLREGSLREGSLREGSLREGSLREGSLREGSLREGSLREGSLREGSLRVVTELISSYLDKIMAPIVRSLPSYVKDSQHALHIFRDFNFLAKTNLFSLWILHLFTPSSLIGKVF